MDSTPPRRRRLRITTPSAQISYVVAAYFLGFFVLLATFAGGPVAAVTTASVFLIASVGIAARSFRGADEPIEPPRAWWRMTSRPAAGFVLAVLFLASPVQVIVLAITSEVDAASVWTGAAGAALGLAYLHSSIRLQSPKPVPTLRAAATQS